MLRRDSDDRDLMKGVWTMRLLLVLVVMTILIGCGAPAYAQGTPGVVASGENELQAKLESYETKIDQAIKDKDTTAFMSYVDPNAISTDNTGFTPASALPAMIKDLDLQSFSIEEYKIMPIDQQTYIATYVWNGKGSYKGEPMPPVPSYCSTVWVQRGNDWKAIYHQESLAMQGPMPGMPPMQGTPPPTGTTPR
jgi:hypothetical protein